MPNSRPFTQGTHGLLLVCGVALAMIGLGAAAELVTHAMSRPAILAPASDAIGSDGRNARPQSGRRACACGWPSMVLRGRSALAPIPDTVFPGAPFPRDGDRTISAALAAPAARRTYLLGSSAVAHRRVWVHEFMATPPAGLQALASGSWQP